MNIFVALEYYFFNMNYLAIAFSMSCISWSIAVLFMFSWTSTNPDSLEVSTIDSTKAVMMKPRRRKPIYSNMLHINYHLMLDLSTYKGPGNSYTHFPRGI